VVSDINRYFFLVDSLETDIQRFIEAGQNNYHLSSRFLYYIKGDILLQSAINKIFYIQKNFVTTQQINSDTKEYLEFVSEIDFNNEEMLQIYSFPKFLLMYIDCIYQLDNPELIDRLMSMSTNVYKLEDSERIELFNTIVNLRVEIAKRVLTGKVLDFWISSELTNQFNHGWIEPFDKIYKQLKDEDLLVNYTNIIDKSYQDTFLFISGSQAPSFTLIDTENKNVSLHDFNGKVVFLNYWASWCEGCRSNLPKLQKIENHFLGRDVIFLNISMDENKDSWIQAVADEGITGINLYANGFGSSIVKDYSIKSIPAYFIIDVDGKIIERIRGPLITEEIIKKIEESL